MIACIGQASIFLHAKGFVLMKKIAIFQRNFKVGGIQKALLNILNDIDYAQCEVDVFVYEDSVFFDMPENENLHYIFMKPYPFLSRLVYFNLLRAVAPKPKTDKEYDIAIDFDSYCPECAVGATSVKAKKRVMWIHNDVEIKQRNEFKYRVLWHFFKAKMKHYDEFAAVSPGIIDGFRRVSGIYDKKITAIPNRGKVELDNLSFKHPFAESDLPVDFSFGKKDE